MVTNKKGFVLTTLAYLRRENKTLFLYRNKKEHDFNKGKYIGIGGHVEKNESYISTMKREIREETGFQVVHYTYRGYVDFINEEVEKERMYVFVVDEFTGTQIDCDEGKLSWVQDTDIMKLNLWEGDRTFLPYVLNSDRRFHLTLHYTKDCFDGITSLKFF